MSGGSWDQKGSGFRLDLEENDGTKTMRALDEKGEASPNHRSMDCSSHGRFVQLYQYLL